MSLLQKDDLNGNFECICKYVKMDEKIINLLQKADLDEKSGNLWIKKYMQKLIKNDKVWWYWNWKAQISPV